MDNRAILFLFLSAMLCIGALFSNSYGDLDGVPIIDWTKISVYRSGAQTFGAGVNTQILLNAENYDVLGEFNTATGNFTTTRTGYYHVNAFQSWTPTENNRVVSLKLYANDTEVVRCQPGGYTTASQDLAIGFDRYFYWGNNTVVSLWLFNGQTVSFELYGNGDVRVNWLTIIWVPTEV